jgi:hypothetical protein
MADNRIFIADTHQGRVIVTRTSKKGEVFRIEMAPSEVDRATKIVGIALGTVEHDDLPDHITNTPFVIRFFKNHVYALERSDLNFSLPFKATEGDELIHTIQIALGMCLNEQTQGKVVPCGTAATNPHMVADESF